MAQHALRLATLWRWQEYRQLRTVQRTPSRSASDFFQVQPAFVDVPAAAHYEVRVHDICATHQCKCDVYVKR